MDYGMKAEAGNFVALGGKAKLTAVRSWPSLLAAAGRLLADNENAAAVIVAHTACEVVTERAMVTKAPAHDELFTYALSTPNKLSKYKQATGDNGIDGEPFWAGYLQLIENRNKAAHEGHEVDRDVVQENID